MSEEAVEEVIEEAVEEAVEEVAEETVEEAVEEVAEEAVEEAVEEAAEEEVVESVSTYEADQLAEEKHIDTEVEEDVEYIQPSDTKKCIVNLDALSDAYEAGDVVDLESLKAKKLVDKRAKSVKVLARGTINKPLTVRAGEFSDTAIKMIKLTGGTAIHVTYKTK